jgi:uncharacterized protein YgiM (DUF1202 family)
MQSMKTRGRPLFSTLVTVILLTLFAVPVGMASANEALPDPQHTNQTGPYATSSGAVNVRTGPGTGFAIAGVLSTAEVVPILGISPDGGWWYIAAHFGEGWVSHISVTAANTSGVTIRDPGPIATVASGAINVRSGPGPFAGVLGQMRQGVQVHVLGKNADGTWLQIRSPYGNGWVSAQLVMLTGTPGIIHDALPVTGEGAHVVVMAAYLNVRSGPGENYAVVGTVGARDELPIVGRTADNAWYQVQAPFGTGWVAGNYVITRNEYGAAPVTTDSAQGAAIAGPIGIINTGALNIRSGPGAQYSSLGVLAGGTETQIIGRTRDWSWWLLETPLGNGWANGIYVIVRGSTRNVPYVAPGEAVPPADGTGGEISPEPDLALPVSTVNTGALNIRSGPNSTFSSLGSVYAGTKLPIIGQSPDRGWWYVQSSFGDGWISKAFAYTTGNTSGVPIVN